jgi:hypothetical protein
LWDAHAAIERLANPAKASRATVVKRGFIAFLPTCQFKAGFGGEPHTPEPDGVEYEYLGFLVPNLTVFWPLFALV